MAKICRKCWNVLEADAFGRDLRSSDGLKSACKKCLREVERGRRVSERGEPSVEDCPVEACSDDSVESNTDSRRRVPVPEVASGFKWCRTCERVLVVDAFRDHVGRPDGLNTSCRECERTVKLTIKTGAADSVIALGRKECRRCGEDLPLDSFPANRRSLDGYAATCSSCRKVQGPSLEDFVFRERLSKIGRDFDLLVEKKREEMARRESFGNDRED